MIKVLFQKEDHLRESSVDEIEKKLGIKYTKNLIFVSDAIIEKVLRQSKKAVAKKQLSMREKWLGTYFAKEISGGHEPKVSLRWINSSLGYGVFAEEEITTGAYIGEYTGLVRRRRRHSDRRNDYCFEYTIGDWIFNPFIIDAKDQGNFTRFINHSEKNPNLESLSVYVDQVMHIIFVALKPIPIGTQLCYHYGDTFWKKRRPHQSILPN